MVTLFCGAVLSHIVIRTIGWLNKMQPVGGCCTMETFPQGAVAGASLPSPWATLRLEGLFCKK